jgi:hypothetical protein
MLRFSLLAAVMAGLMVSASVAEAGIFFRRGGCPGGRCGVVYSAPATTAVQSQTAQSEAADGNRENAPAPQVAQGDASSSGQAAAASQPADQQATPATNNSVRRVGLRRVGGWRLFGRWR